MLGDWAYHWGLETGICNWNWELGVEAIEVLEEREVNTSDLIEERKGKELKRRERD